jgi:hypothetical protein
VVSALARRTTYELLHEKTGVQLVVLYLNLHKDKRSVGRQHCIGTEHVLAQLGLVYVLRVVLRLDIFIGTMQVLGPLCINQAYHS